MARETKGSLKAWKKKELALVALQKRKTKKHDCFDHAVYVETEGRLGQAYYCGKCGSLIQVG